MESEMTLFPGKSWDDSTDGKWVECDCKGGAVSGVGGLLNTMEDEERECRWVGELITDEGNEGPVGSSPDTGSYPFSPGGTGGWY